ncbi:MAG TPA: protein translocase subunit SecF [Alphaproteobacteria bacterium]|nr:protein translocase subunit SecF [Alphaproteobacteria bacterium]
MRKLRLIPDNTKFDFLGRRVLFLGISTALILLSVGLIAVRGINFGVDFRGGILIEARTAGPADLGDLRTRLNGLGLGEVGLQEFGAPTDVLINFGEQPGGERAQLAAIEKVKATLSDTVAEYRRIEVVGPKVGAELVRGGIIATLLAMAAIAIYVWFRFEWQFGVAALLSLVHDVITTLGLFAVFQFEFNLPTLAAVLTIAGYSINDTVVIFDRVREDLRKFKKMPLAELLNHAVNSTLTRTVLTGMTTLLVLTALAIFGGEVIRGFAIAMIWGVLIGTYSSFGVAVPLLIYFGLKQVSQRQAVASAEASAEPAAKP